MLPHITSELGFSHQVSTEYVRGTTFQTLITRSKLGSFKQAQGTGHI